MKKHKRRKAWKIFRPGRGKLRGNIVIAPPFKNKDGVLMEWIPWDEV